MSTKKSAALSSGNLKRSTLKEVECNISPKSDSVKFDEAYLLRFYRRFYYHRFSQDLLKQKKVISVDSSYWKCHRFSIGSLMEIYRNSTEKTAYYQHVETCGNSRACPVCAPRVMGTRSAEIRSAVHSWLGECPLNTCYLLTLTFSHSVSDTLSDLICRFSAATQTFWRNGSVRRMLCSQGYFGRINSLEVQYSLRNGYHPHLHILIFSRHIHDIRVDALKQHWLAALACSRLHGSFEYALDLIEARSAEQYLTKISSEMSLGHWKEGRDTGHYSPFQVLQLASEKYDWASSVWCDYYQSMKGVHSLYWSKGLKKYFGISEKSDKDISDGGDLNDLDLFCAFPGYQYRLFSTQFRSLLIAYSAAGDFAAVRKLFSTVGVPVWRKYNGELF